MKKTLITAIALAFAAVSFAAQPPAAKPAASNAGQSTSTGKTKVKHHGRKSIKKGTKTTSPTK